MTDYRDWILELLDRRRSRRADDVPWRTKDVRAFADKHLIPPRSDYTLYRLICRHLNDIQGYYERSEVPDMTPETGCAKAIWKSPYATCCTMNSKNVRAIGIQSQPSRRWTWGSGPT